ncbi:MAG: hypothetical protein K0S12_2499 [Bacteroidetes bacterium]|jgi:effector-binding domain-containing protein|nr:hypothetical protein [Bacteroidota bacterium]
MRNLPKYILGLGLLALNFSCSDPEAVQAKDEAVAEVKKDSVAQENTEIANILKKYDQFSEAPGVAGIYEVSEMLTLCRKDSASSEKMAEAFAKNYSLLEADLKLLKIKSEGAPGSIYYNNDQNNLIFECVYPIMEMPDKKPKNSAIVALEASPMLIYNHYGPYSDLYRAYANIKAHLARNLLVQAGPMREFYINDPTKIRDSSKWLTRVMVPVMKKKAKK